MTSWPPWPAGQLGQRKPFPFNSGRGALYGTWPSTPLNLLDLWPDVHDLEQISLHAFLWMRLLVKRMWQCNYSAWLMCQEEQTVEMTCWTQKKKNRGVHIHWCLYISEVLNLLSMLRFHENDHSSTRSRDTVQKRAEQNVNTIGDKGWVSSVRKRRLLRMAATLGAWACVLSTCLSSHLPCSCQHWHPVSPTYPPCGYSRQAAELEVHKAARLNGTDWVGLWWSQPSRRRQ